MNEINDKPLDTLIIKEEAAIVEKMVDDETWYEGERRGCFIPKDDPTVMDKVFNILHDNGLKIYNEVKEKLKKRV